ncbi:MAG TPA: LuxR C-terminal-related transcriptional regulator, partial [Capillimicrobium sp.]|nr:LuxR C-terminal-related transcriptional regulator [Capillimicrobium sp.]
VREAIGAEAVASATARLHRRAARLRADAGAGAQEVAAHLLHTDPAGEDWAAAALAEAGRRALAEGAPDVAVRLLRRALDEAPEAPGRPALLLALGQAEARTGNPAAIDHLAQAASAGSADIRVRADRIRAQMLVLDRRTGEAARLLGETAATAADAGPGAVEQVESDLLDVLAHQTPPPPEYRARLEAGAAGERATPLAHLAFARAIGGAPAAEVLGLVHRARAAARRAGDRRFMHYYAFEALLLVEAADEAAGALREASALEQQLGSRIAAGPLAYMTSAWVAWERRFGDLREAEERARYGLDLALAAGASAVVDNARAALAIVLLDRGDLDAAEEQIAHLPPVETGPGLKETHAMRARLLALQGRHEEALAELEAELELERARGWVTGNREPCRVTLVRVLLALGRDDEARRAADDLLAVALRRGVPGLEGRARYVRAWTLDRDAALDELRRGAEVARRSPSPIAQAEALAELGAALRRAGLRTEARQPLAEARDLAHRCGAAALERRCAEELLMAGARPRRVALSGVESLTAAERRVADLAARGLRNREIADELFVTLKTVEVHLSRIYGKLGIQNRTQLAAALGADAA